MRGSKELSTKDRCLCQIDSEQGSHSKGHDMQVWAEKKKSDIEWRPHLLYHLKAVGWLKGKWNVETAG